MKQHIRTPEQAREKAARQREAAARGGAGETPAKRELSANLRNHASNPKYARARRVGERKLERMLDERLGQ